MNTVFIAERIIPAHTISRCCDCRHLERFPDDSPECYHMDAPDYSRISDDDEIPDWCPLLKRNS